MKIDHAPCTGKVTTTGMTASCARCGEHWAAVEGEGMVAGAWCAICGGTDGLAREGGQLECKGCRDCHPRSGRYSFGERAGGLGWRSSGTRRRGGHS